MRDIYFVRDADKDSLEFISTDKRACYAWKELKCYLYNKLEVGKGIILTDDEAYYFTAGAF